MSWHYSASGEMTLLDAQSMIDRGETERAWIKLEGIMQDKFQPSIVASLSIEENRVMQEIKLPQQRILRFRGNFEDTESLLETVQRLRSL